MLGYHVGSWLRALGLQNKVDLIAKAASEHPSRDQLKGGHLIVVRDGGIDKWVCFTCPCGCGEKIQLPMSKSRRPQWSAKIDWFGRPSVQPSVRQIAGCRAHFWIKRGKVEWCRDSPTPRKAKID